MSGCQLLGLLGLLGFLGDVCYAQLTVRSLLIQSHIRYRFATTLVTSIVVNDDDTKSKEALFEVVLPEEAFISNFSMTVDGEVYVGRVEEKRKAMKEYQDAKRRGESTGYIKTTARRSNKFDVSVNLKPGSSVHFNLTYQHLLSRVDGMYEHDIHVNPGRVVRNLQVEVYVEESRNITALTANFRNEQQDNSPGEELVEVSYAPLTSRYVIFKRTREQQEKAGPKGTSGHFVVRYDVQRSVSAGEILVVDGYFLHFFSSENSESTRPVPKDILFILDISGSMTGTRLSQLKQAMVTILKELGANDTFNIYTFNDRVATWKSHFQPVTHTTLMAAEDFVMNLRADDSTDINMALTEGVKFLLKETMPKHTPLIFFLTDGQPTSGVKNSGVIANNVESLNEGVSSVFSLAFGQGADYDLVKVISVQNNGFARKIYEAADASEQVRGFYNEISAPMLRNLTVKYLNDTVQQDTLTPTFFKNVFRGIDIVISGKLKEGSTTIEVNVTGEDCNGIISLVLDDTDGILLLPETGSNPYFQLPVDFASVTEKSWAYLTIKNLLKEKKMDKYKEVDADIDRQIMQLSLQYNFVTPLTSMVATKPNKHATHTHFEGDDYGALPPVAGSTQKSKYNTGAPGRRYGRGKKVYHYPSNVDLARSHSAHLPVPYLDSHGGGGLAGIAAESAVMLGMTMAPYPTTSTNLIQGDRKLKKQNQRKRFTTTTTPSSIWRRAKAKHKKCKIGKAILIGFVTRVSDKITDCVKTKRATIGRYQIYPPPPTPFNSSGISVTATFRKKRILKMITVVIRDGSTILDDVVLDPTNTSWVTWTSRYSPAGNVTVIKNVACNGKRNKAKIVIVISTRESSQTDDSIQIAGQATHSLKVAHKVKKGKKKDLVSTMCMGHHVRKQKLHPKSDRFISN